jgi:hypothetical protein
VAAGGTTVAQGLSRTGGPSFRLGSPAATQFPSIKAKRLLAVLERMEAPGQPPLTFAFHDKATIPSGLVRKILIQDVGLAEDEARKLL